MPALILLAGAPEVHHTFSDFVYDNATWIIIAIILLGFALAEVLSDLIQALGERWRR